jgi:hypothetical protein
MPVFTTSRRPRGSTLRIPNWHGSVVVVLQGRFAAPLLFADRLTRGQFTPVWILVVFATFHLLDQPLLTALVVGFWAYTWTVHIYVRARVGKAPK